VLTSFFFSLDSDAELTYCSALGFLRGRTEDHMEVGPWLALRLVRP
jgi:hypothetical protein